MVFDGTQHLLLAIVARAVQDLSHENPHVQMEARQWLMQDSLCVEICDLLGMSLSTLRRAVERPPPLV